MTEKKTYGLIFKKTQKLVKNVSNAVEMCFGDEEEPVEVSNKPFDPRKIETNVGSSISQKLSKAQLDKALKEDETVCQYDEVFDEMEEQKKLADPRRSQDSKDPKYVNELLKTAAFRKRERARRMDRKIQKERDEEEGQFDDTEVFITDTYRQKLEERQQEEIEIKVKDKLDEISSSQMKDMSQFYRQCVIKQQESRSIFVEAPVSGIVEKTLIEQPKLIEAIINDTVQETENKREPVIKDTGKNLEEKTAPTPKIETPVVKKDKYEIYYRRNDDKSTEEARQRYLERKNVFINKYLAELAK